MRPADGVGRSAGAGELGRPALGIAGPRGAGHASDHHRRRRPERGAGVGLPSHPHAGGRLGIDVVRHGLHLLRHPGIDLITGHERVVAGTASYQGFYGDGGRATAAGLGNPTGIAVDGQGNLYIADTWNRRVRKVTPAGRIGTFAGGGASAVRGDGGPATSADIDPHAVAVGLQGDVFILDGDLVRKVDAAGVISTVSGGGALPLRDGVRASDGKLTYTRAIDVDARGNLYLAENRRVWRIDADGIAHAAARNDGKTTTDWDYPAAVLARPDGTLLVATGNRVVAVDDAATTTVVAGNGTSGFAGDGGAATSAELWYPTGLELDTAGNL